MKFILALALLCTPAFGQTYTAFASPEHPFVSIPGQPGATSVTVTARVTLEREFMTAQLDTDFDGLGIVTFNAAGSFERVTVRDPFGGVLATHQGNPFPVTVFVPDPGTPVFTQFSQLLGQSTQVNTVNRGFAASVVTLPVTFQGQFATQFQSGFCRARESVHPVAEITVTYN